MALPVPAAPKPKTVAPRRFGPGWTGRTVLEGEVLDGIVTRPVNAGEVVCVWTANHGTVYYPESTWAVLSHSERAIAALQEAQAEAKRTMPTAVVRDVSLAARLSGDAVVTQLPAQPGRRPQAKLGIEELQQQLVAFVQDMNRFGQPTLTQQQEFAKRYHVYRDRMAELRGSFTATDGMFEIAQQMLLRYLD